MVVYDLICKKSHRFEGWFPNFETYQEQVSKGLVSCPSCGATKVEKLPHACAIVSRRSDKEEAREPKIPRPQPTEPSEADVKEMLFRVHHYVQQNFEDVGPRFAEEARAIFVGEKEKKAIHGTATPKEREELDQDGVPYLIVPKPKTDS